jgi:glutaminyl-tRNA synthetase
LWIERADFAENPPKGYRRLVAGGEVRLRHGYVIRCHAVVKDDDGSIAALHCTYDPQTRGGTTPDGRKVKGTIQWVSAAHALEAEVRLFGPLLRPMGEGDQESDITERFDPASLGILKGAKVEPSVAHDDPATRYQFERIGYFRRDPVDGGKALIFNRIVALKSTYDAGVQSAASGGSRGSDRADTGTKGRRVGQGSKASAAEATSGPAVKPQMSEDRVRAREADATLGARFTRYQDELGLSQEHADLLTETRPVGDFFEAAVGVHDDAPAVAAWVVTDVRGVLDGRELDELPFDGADLGRLAALVADGAVTRRAAKDVLAQMAEHGGDAATWVDELGLATLTDTDALGDAVDGVLGSWPDKVAEYRAGNGNLIGLFVGEVMKATGGAADPKAARALLVERLES